MSQKIKKVAIIGAGPVGLIAAVDIAKLGIEVEVFDVAEGLDRRPRGAGYGPSAAKYDIALFWVSAEVMRRAGVLDRIREDGLELYDFCWRKLGGEYITGIKGVFNEAYEDRYITLPVDQVTEIIYNELQKYENARVYWQHDFKSFTQDDKNLTLYIEHHGQPKLYTADFLLGCDGGRSDVRRALFGRTFPGYTWDVQIVATNLQFPDGRMEKYGWSDISWIIHPEHWAVIAKIEVNPDVWRVSYGEPAHLTEEELRARCAEKLSILLPGSPGPEDYELGRFSPYKVQQRCAPKMRVGRVLLAGDAAHLCNPMGGLGLTGGMADVGSLIDCLRGIHGGLASMDILDLYDQKRREKYYTVTDPVSTVNLKRLFLPGEDALMLDPGLQRIKEAMRDPATAKLLFEASDNLTVDMTQYYDLKPDPNGSDNHT